MKTMKKAIALLVCAIMIMSACPITVFSANTDSVVNAPQNYDIYSDDYYWRYTFDGIAAGYALDGTLTKVQDSDSNPYGMSLDGSLLGTILSHGDGSGNYLGMRYTNASWRGMRLSLVNGNTDLGVANGVETCFRFRWVGTGVVSEGADMSFFGIRRAKVGQNNRFDFGLLKASVDQTTGELIIRAVLPDGTLKDIYRIPKMSDTNKAFTEFRVVYHDVTNTYSVYINGKAYVEGLGCYQNPRSADAVTTTYDSEFFATRTPVSGASDKWSMQLFRIDKSGEKQFNYHFDVDDIVIREGDWYSNSFETALTAFNDFNQENVVSNHVFYVRKGTPVIETEANGNKYISMKAGSRIDIKDYAYQVLQDGNWTVDFKVKSDGAANIMRLFDRVSTRSFLNVQADGSLKLGNVVIPDVVVPKTTSDKWLNLTVSFLVDDVNAGKFPNFVDDKMTSTTTSRGYRIALWVDGEYVGSSADYARTEVITSDSNYYLLNDCLYIVSDITAEPDVSSLALVCDNSGLKTYFDATTTNYYQLKYTDGVFTAGKLLKYDSKRNEDVLGFWDGGSVEGAFDDISLYKGVGPKHYATDKADTTGVISDFNFGTVAEKSIHQMTETPYNTGGGVLWSNATGLNSGVHHQERVAANGDEPAYVKLSSDGVTKGHLDLRADNSGGKVFAANLTLRKFNAENNVELFILRRQAKGTSGFFTSYNIFAEATTGNVGFKADGVNYYLCDESGNKVNLGGDKWIKLTAIFDETGSETLVSFLVDDEPAYYTSATTASIAIPFPTVNNAVGISGIVSKDVYDARNYIDQRVRIYNADKGDKFAFEALSASVEYATVPDVEVKTYSDYAAIDFSKYDDIDELKAEYGAQICIKGDVTIEDGILNVPAGATFAWLDMNGKFAKHWENAQAVSGLYVNGYTFEMKLRSDYTGDGIFQINFQRAGSTYRQVKLAAVKSGGDENLLMNSSYAIEPLSSDKFSTVALTYTNDNIYGNVFADGCFVGTVGYGAKFLNTDLYTSFVVPENSQIAELYIRPEIDRELAKSSGEVFRIDPSVFAPTAATEWPRFGLTSKGGILADANITTTNTYTSDEESFKYFSLDFNHPDDDPNSDIGVLKSHNYIDIYLTDYLTDKISVFEFNLRFTPHEKESKVNMSLVWLRRALGATNNHFAESILDLTGKGTLVYNNHELLNADGTPVVLSAEDWTNVAAIYDATAGQVGFRVGGKIPYILDGEKLVLADKLQLADPVSYRIDDFETRLRTFSCASSSTSMFFGTLDVAYLDIYTVDSTANASFIGVQTDAENNVRLVAATDMLYYSSVGFEVEAFDADGNSLSESSKKYTDKVVYSSIVETVGENEQSVYPWEYGYRYFYTANIEGIPQNEAVKLNVTPFTVIGGEQYNASTITLDIDFTKTENTVITKTVEAKPQGQNESKDANFSTTDVITYTEDGGLDLNGKNAKFGFAADLDGGVVSVNLTNSFGETVEATELDVYVDGVLVNDGLVLDFGHHTLVLAEGLEGEHSFVIVKKTGGDYIRINNFSVNGTVTEPPLLAEENAVNLVVHAPAAGDPYGSANVYVRTSDASGKYYINYQFSFINWGLNDYDYSNGAANSHNNAHMYRINTATLVEKTADGYKDVFQVLQGGEISLAFKEVWKGKAAADFVGGWHGDENIEDDKVFFFLDGEPIDITTAGNYIGTSLVFDQTSLIDRCDTEETQILRHRQYMVLDTNGLRNNQSVEFLVNDYVGDRTQTYMQMCTFNRQNMSLSESERVKPENFICKEFNMLDANGGVISSTVLDSDEGTTKGYSNQNRYVEYIGNNNGLYGLVGFSIDDRSTQLRNMGIMVRNPQGDNKLYASFVSHAAAETSQAVPMYEVWNVDDYYYIDYNTANIK